MLEEDFLRDEFITILEAKRQSASCLAQMLEHVDDPNLRESILQLQARAMRNVQLSERLLEIVS